MKTLFTLIFSFMLVGSALAQHENHENQQEQHQHSNHLETLIGHYMEAKDALFQDEFESAKEHIQAFAEEVEGSDEMNNHDEQSEKHEEHHNAMVAAVTEASGAEDIGELRAAFKKVSDELITAVENQGYEGALFKQFCPMYGNGSNWLSTEEEVQNPFYGQAMPGCGDVIERIGS